MMNHTPLPINLLATYGGGFSVGTAMGWTSPALPHIADCQEDCDFQFDDITGNHEKLSIWSEDESK